MTAQVCDVARAATLTDTHAACVVTYNSAAYLSATAHRLGMPVEVKQGVKYCYNLPVPASAKGSAQHCQVGLYLMPAQVNPDPVLAYARMVVLLRQCHSQCD